MISNALVNSAKQEKSDDDILKKVKEDLPKEPVEINIKRVRRTHFPLAIAGQSFGVAM